MEIIEPTIITDPPKELREHIAVLVTKFGCTVCVPLSGAIPLDYDAIAALDRTWNPQGVRVTLRVESVAAGLVNAARLKRGMGPHPTFCPWITFSPEVP